VPMGPRNSIVPRTETWHSQCRYIPFDLGWTGDLDARTFRHRVEGDFDEFNSYLSH
jgi:hypothetical protein